MRPNLANATYASIVMACIAPTEDPAQNVTPEIGRDADIGNAKSTITGLHMTGEDMDINVPQALAPDTPDTSASLAPPDGADTVVTDTVQHAALVELRHMMELQEPHGDFTLSQNSELRNLGTISGSFSPVRLFEDVSTKSVCEDGTMFDTDGTLVHRDRERTQDTSQPEAQQKDEDRQIWHATTRAVSQTAPTNLP